MIALFLVDKGWGFLAVNKPAVVVWQSATMTAGKTAPTDNQLADIQALSTHAPASNRRQAGYP